VGTLHIVGFGRWMGTDFRSNVDRLEYAPTLLNRENMTDEFKIVSTPEWDALHAFDVANNIEPARRIARRIAMKYDCSQTHPIVDDIAHAIEDALTIGARRGLLEAAAIASVPRS